MTPVCLPACIDFPPFIRFIAIHPNRFAQPGLRAGRQQKGRFPPESYAICGSDLMIKGEDVSHIVFGNTLGSGRSKNGAVDGDGHPNRQFHYMLANPPFGVEWKPEKGHVTKENNELGFDGRFGPGLPRINDGALLFLLHMISKMNPPPQQGGFVKMKKSLGNKRHELGDGSDGKLDHIGDITRSYVDYTENVPLPDDISLPLPLDYENKRTKGKIDKSALLALVQDHCEAYLIKEVLPYRPDAWIDHGKIKVGYEIPFNRHFYKYQPPRPLEEIEADIKTLEKEIIEMLGEVTRG